jgi:hypothetical protein
VGWRGNLVTFAFILIFSLLSAVVAVMDLFFFHKPVEVFFQSVLSLQFGTRKWWVFSGLFAGLLYSIRADYKRYKAKKGVSKGT